jgi:hypothetical protein
MPQAAKPDTIQRCVYLPSTIRSFGLLTVAAAEADEPGAQTLIAHIQCL